MRLCGDNQNTPACKKYMHNDLVDAKLGPPFRTTNRTPAEAGPRPKSTRFAQKVGTRKKDHFCTKSWSFANCSYDFPLQRFWGPKNGTKKVPNFRYRFPSVCPHTFQAKWLHKLTCPLARISFSGHNVANRQGALPWGKLPTTPHQGSKLSTCLAGERCFGPARQVSACGVWNRGQCRLVIEPVVAHQGHRRSFRWTHQGECSQMLALGVSQTKIRPSSRAQSPMQFSPIIALQHRRWLARERARTQVKSPATLDLHSETPGVHTARVTC